jgi:prepilin-type N-terminal cleavage/methylation domain-containing protein
VSIYGERLHNGGRVCAEGQPSARQERARNRDDNVIEQAFTLIELLIVITILGILAGIVVFAVGNLTSNTQTSACATEKSTIGTALETYKAQNGAYPPNMAALTSTGVRAANF